MSCPHAARRAAVSSYVPRALRNVPSGTAYSNAIARYARQNHPTAPVMTGVVLLRGADGDDATDAFFTAHPEMAIILMRSEDDAHLERMMNDSGRRSLDNRIRYTFSSEEGGVRTIRAESPKGNVQTFLYRVSDEPVAVTLDADAGDDLSRYPWISIPVARVV